MSGLRIIQALGQAASGTVGRITQLTVTPPKPDPFATAVRPRQPEPLEPQRTTTATLLDTVAAWRCMSENAKWHWTDHCLLPPGSCDACQEFTAKALVPSVDRFVEPASNPQNESGDAENSTPPLG